MVAILKKREDSILFQKAPICTVPASKSKFQCPKHNARGLKRTSQRLDRRLEIFSLVFVLPSSLLSQVETSKFQLCKLKAAAHVTSARPSQVKVHQTSRQERATHNRIRMLCLLLWRA